MRRRYSYTEIVNVFFTLLLAFVLTYKAPIRYLEYHGNERLAGLLGTVSLYGAIIFAVLTIIRRKDYLRHSAVVLAFFCFLYLYQRLVVPSDSLSIYWYSFFINGFAGFLCGIALIDPKRLVKIAGLFSFIYGVLLIPEPITRALLGYTSMNLGYTMAPLTIWLIILWYFSDKYKKVILVAACLLGAMTLLFTSRGCGISVVAAAMTVKIIDSKKRNVSLSKTFIGLSLAIIVALFLFRELAAYFVLRSDITLLTGSSLNKIMTGMFIDDNGRAKLFSMAVDLYKQNWAFGVGMGADRKIIGYVFPHNIFIEILLHFGLFMSILIFIFYWRSVIKGVKISYRTDYAILIPVICCIYWIRLLFSDSYLSNSFGLMFVLGFSIQIYCKYRTGELNE